MSNETNGLKRLTSDEFRGFDVTAAPNTGLTRASDVKEEKVNWLFEPFIPRAALTIVDGDPGEGKGQFTCFLAAQVTNPANEYSFGAMNEEPQNVLMLSAEDSYSHVVTGRLRVAGANLGKVVYVNEGLSLDRTDDFEKFESYVEEVQPGLITIDPMFSYLGAVNDSNTDSKARIVLNKLIEIAEKYNCAIALVRHLTKQTQKALYAGGGSIAYTGAARSALLLGHDDAGNHAIVQIKNSYGEKSSVGYRIESHHSGIPYLVLTGETSITANNILCADTPKPNQSLSREDQAEEFLMNCLKDGAKETSEVNRLAEKQAISVATLKRAKTSLLLKSRKVGSVWYSALSAEALDGLSANQTTQEGNGKVVGEEKSSGSNALDSQNELDELDGLNTVDTGTYSENQLAHRELDELDELDSTGSFELDDELDVSSVNKEFMSINQLAHQRIPRENELDELDAISEMDDRRNGGIKCETILSTVSNLEAMTQSHDQEDIMDNYTQLEQDEIDERTMTALEAMDLAKSRTRRVTRANYDAAFDPFELPSDEEVNKMIAEIEAEPSFVSQGFQALLYDLVNTNHGQYYRINSLGEAENARTGAKRHAPRGYQYPEYLALHQYDGLVKSQARHHQELNGIGELAIAA